MDRPVLDAGELREAVLALKKIDLVRLRRAGRLYALRLDCELDDLLGDAIMLALSGSRTCPRDMEVLPFLVGIMRSRASALRQSAKRKGIPVPIDDNRQEDMTVIPLVETTPHDLLDRADDYAARVQALEALFADDPEALRVLSADLRQAEKAEIMAALNIDAVQYATIRRRMRRRIDKGFPKGWDNG
jgi:DNA-directed RNA polymerase specialized sigma24 family protein